MAIALPLPPALPGDGISVPATITAPDTIVPSAIDYIALGETPITPLIAPATATDGSLGTPVITVVTNQGGGKKSNGSSKDWMEKTKDEGIT